MRLSVLPLFIFFNLVIIIDMCMAQTGGKYLLSTVDTMYLIDEFTCSYGIVFVDNPYSFLEEKSRLSASGRYLAIPSIVDNSNTDRCPEDSIEAIDLVVIDLLNKTSTCICNVSKYDWSPVKDKLAYINEEKDDKRREADVGDNFFSGCSVAAYDPASGLSTELEIDATSIRCLCWSKNDGKIYVRHEDGVIQYDPATKFCKEMPYQSVYISPDGKYCFRETVDDPCGLYLTADQSEIPFIEVGTNEPLELYSDFIAWGVIDSNTVVYTIYDFFGYIDCATGRLYEIKPPSPEIDPVRNLVGFKNGRPVWARIAGDKAELFYY